MTKSELHTWGCIQRIFTQSLTKSMNVNYPKENCSTSEKDKWTLDVKTKDVDWYVWFSWFTDLSNRSVMSFLAPCPTKLLPFSYLHLMPFPYCKIYLSSHELWYFVSTSICIFSPLYLKYSFTLSIWNTHTCPSKLFSNMTFFGMSYFTL